MASMVFGFDMLLSLLEWFFRLFHLEWTFTLIFDGELDDINGFRFWTGFSLLEWFFRLFPHVMDKDGYRVIKCRLSALALAREEARAKRAPTSHPATTILTYTASSVNQILLVSYIWKRTVPQRDVHFNVMCTSTWCALQRDVNFNVMWTSTWSKLHGCPS